MMEFKKFQLAILHSAMTKETVRYNPPPIDNVYTYADLVGRYGQDSMDRIARNGTTIRDAEEEEL